MNNKYVNAEDLSSKLGDIKNLYNILQINRK